MGRIATAATLLAVAIAAAGCNDDGPDAGTTPGTGSPRAAAVPNADARIIREWSDLLRDGKVAGATALFALPATVENGTGPLILDSRAQVRGFNESLPCGAKLLTTTRRGPYTVATFRLTERPGGDCGTGGGQKAATAFRIEDGHIVEWLRVAVPPEQPPPEPRPKPGPPSDRPAPSDTV